jgi:hypothetical protein
MRPIRRAGQEGMILFPVVIIIVLTAALSGALFVTVVSENRASRTTFESTQARTLAEGALQMVKKDVLRTLAEHEELPGDPLATTPQGWTLPSGLPLAGGTVREGSVTLGGSDEGHAARFRLAPFGDPRPVLDPDGITTWVIPFRVEAQARFREAVNTVNQIVDIGESPLAQYAMFFNGDLELLPGPLMRIYGRVHSNRNIHIGSLDTIEIRALRDGANNVLQAPYLRCVGGVYRRKKHLSGLAQARENMGTVLVEQRRSDGILDLRRMDSYQQLTDDGVFETWNGVTVHRSGFDTDFRGFDANGDGDFTDPGDVSPWTVESMGRWLGAVQTGAHGITERVTPRVGSIQPQGWFHQRALEGGLVVKTEVNGPTETHTLYHGGQSITIPAGAVRSSSIYDARENNGSGIPVTEIDLAALLFEEPDPSDPQPRYYRRDANGRMVVDLVTGTHTRSSLLDDFNGLVYAWRDDASAGSPAGIQVINANILPPQVILSPPELRRLSLNIVTPDPVYLKGDFNHEPGFAFLKGNAAVIADAVNLLSNAWDGTKNPSQTQLPDATPTTYNLAMIAGNVETVPTADGSLYGGGAENLVRFHENWNGQTCTINGAFVSLFPSQIARGPWRVGGRYYQPPTRAWAYDPDFLNPQVSQLLFFPFAYYVKDVAYYTPGGLPTPAPAP